MRFRTRCTPRSDLVGIEPVGAQNAVVERTTRLKSTARAIGDSTCKGKSEIGHLGSTCLVLEPRQVHTDQRLGHDVPGCFFERFSNDCAIQ
jgi:hypothetical protein